MGRVHRDQRGVGGCGRRAGAVVIA
jgi:hypothetical protein